MGESREGRGGEREGREKGRGGEELLQGLRGGIDAPANNDPAQGLHTLKSGPRRICRKGTF